MFYALLKKKFIARVFACTISDKHLSKNISIICLQMDPRSIIMTDKQIAYDRLCNYDFIHAVLSINTIL